MKEIDDGSVDAVIADPPYGTTACKWDSVIPLEPMWEQLKRVIKPNGAIVLFGSQPFTSVLVMSNLKWFKYCWVWEKTLGTNPMLVKKQPFRKHEDITVFYKKQPTYNPQMTSGAAYKDKQRESGLDAINGGVRGIKKEINNTGTRYPSSVQKFSNGNNGNCHPTQKPVALMEYLIRTYTNEGETVLDFTMGSGTTGVACVKTKRDFIGIELDEGYFKIAEQRIMETEPSIF
jgi:site-specific DNA-methyltransferase (adenine-specific)